MNIKDETSRMTVDISKESHKQLKVLSVLLGKSMREIVVESIEDYMQKINLPNKQTRAALQNVEDGHDLVKASSVEDLFKKLGI